MTTILLIGGGIAVAIIAALRIAGRSISFKSVRPGAQPTPEERRIKLQYDGQRDSLRDERGSIDEQAKKESLNDIARDLNRRHDK